MMNYEFHNTKRVVALQTGGQVLHYAELKRHKSDLIIPIGPEAMYHAENNNWTTCNLGSLWSGEDYEQAKLESQARIDGLIDALDVYSKGLFPDLGIEIGSYYAFQLWVIIGQIHYNYFIAHSIAKRIRPERVLIYTKDIDQQFLELRPDPERVFADVVSRSGCFKAENIEIQKISEKSRENTTKERILSLLPQIMSLRLREFRSKWKVRNSRRATYRLLMIGGAYDWAKISQYEAFRNVFSIHTMPKLMAKRDGNPPMELVDILSSSVEYAGNTAYDLKSLASAIHADMSLYAERNKKLKNRLKRYDAVVTGVLTYPWENYLAHLAAKMNKPAIVWQHGEKGQSQEMTALQLWTELSYATDYLAYGPSVSDQYRSWIAKTRLINVETVGSFEKNVVWRGGKVIIYATGKWLKTMAPFGPQDPDRRLFDAHKTILDYLDPIAAEHPVIFKANNTPGLNEIPYAYSHIRIDYRTPFTELLKTAGVVILDTPATTLVESCSTKVPIFVLGGRTEYLPDFLERIKRRVVWCDNPKELVMKIDSYLRTGLYEADVDDDTYSREYCATLEPGEVVSRVKKTLINAIDRSLKANKNNQ
jgi:hypothetical protein